MLAFRASGTRSSLHGRILPAAPFAGASRLVRLDQIDSPSPQTVSFSSLSFPVSDLRRSSPSLPILPQTDGTIPSVPDCRLQFAYSQYRHHSGLYKSGSSSEFNPRGNQPIGLLGDGTSRRAREGRARRGPMDRLADVFSVLSESRVTELIGDRYTSFQQERGERKKNEAFRYTTDLMMETPGKFTYRAFLKMLRKLAEHNLAGEDVVSRVRKRLSPKEDESMSELKKRIRMLEAMTPDELDSDQREIFSHSALKLIAEAAESEKRDVEQLLSEHEQRKVIRSWFMRRKELGIPLPRDQEELQDYAKVDVPRFYASKAFGAQQDPIDDRDGRKLPKSSRWRRVWLAQRSVVPKVTYWMKHIPSKHFDRWRKNYMGVKHVRGVNGPSGFWVRQLGKSAPEFTRKHGVLP
uniref:Uncharacterized protein n=1 Tax=Chromera velia CCMP2878 TaxID=1169474 RepID=A0A0G4I561_9ALVE|eukprot:Cvel_1815.t1-p1 / transcript=Cvel_1815.t1 / gene=Cvel_1815 / organism=Chromera_velia_CCMP2878 / gene_product=hypothetical protein / transcript_product=hypothetical protein / location=Cvel_scaffold67:19947-21167(+) / protein_length=407 / sequence_SO=supercontig / SO=protein_coding / is_pseudo=false